MAEGGSGGSKQKRSVKKTAPAEVPAGRWTSIGRNSLLVILAAAILLWLKSGEGVYDELVSNAKSLNFDPYATLEVRRDASTTEIKKAYRQLSLLWHPDKRESCDDKCHLKFDQITEAHKILSNPRKRHLYDTTEKVHIITSDSSFTNEMHPFEYTYTPELWDNVVQPSVQGKQLGMPEHISGVWVVLVTPERSSFTEHILPIWSDLAAKFYGRVSFLRINADDPTYEKRMPFRIGMKPAFFMMSPAEAPLFYTEMSKFSPYSFAEWINKNMPNVLTRWQGTSQQLADYMMRGRNPKTGQIPAAVISNKLPGTVIKALAIKTNMAVEWIQPHNSEFMRLMDAHTAAEEPKIGDGAAIVSRVNGKGFVRIVSNKAYLLDNPAKGALAKDDMSETMAGKYMDLMARITKKIISENAIPAYRETYRYACGALDATKYCLVGDHTSRDYTEAYDRARELLGNDDQLQKIMMTNGFTLHDVGLPFNTKGCTAGLVQLAKERAACINPDSSSIDWIDMTDSRLHFPRLRKTDWEVVGRWMLDHPIYTLGLFSIVPSLYALIRYLRSLRDASADI